MTCLCVCLLFQPSRLANRSRVAAAYQSHQLYRAGCMQNETSASDTGWNISGPKEKTNPPFTSGRTKASETSFAHRLPIANQFGLKPHSGCFSQCLAIRKFGVIWLLPLLITDFWLSQMKNIYIHKGKSHLWKIHKDERRDSRRAGGASAQASQGEELGC